MADGLDELDNLINSLGGSSSSRPVSTVQPTPTRTTKQPSAPANDFRPVNYGQNSGGFNSNYSQPRTTPQVSNNSGGVMPRNEVDQLIGSMNSQLKNVGDGNTASRGICAYCGNPIIGETMTAMGKVYHIDHFVCGNCHDPIGTRNFFEVDGKPNCDKCYHSLFAPICAHCNQGISDRCITAMGKKWHPNHFVCTECQQPFPGGQYFERDGHPYCQTHFHGTFAPKCAQCGGVITSDCVNALGQQWHPDHFACEYCHKAFGGSPFYEYNGKPYCEAHYNQMSGAICAGCSKPVSGRVVQALGKKWHPEHFVCTFCMNPLPGGNYTESAGKAYCKACYAKLFGS